MRKKTVLLVDEDQDFPILLKEAFKAVGVSCHLQIVKTRLGAKGYLKGQGPFANRDVYPFPALILLAMRLQLYNGFRLLRWIRSQPEYLELPTFVLSGVKIDDEDRIAHELGSDCYAEKTDDFKSLVKIVEKLRDRWVTPPTGKTADSQEA